jgi:hypothetical protein
MKNAPSIDIDPAVIRPLAQAQNEFLQVLLSTFSLRQGERGIVLDVEFDFESPAIWLRRGRTHIRRQLDPASTTQYQQELERVLLAQETKEWTHDDAAFPFRFGNGGTLPVIRCGNKDYYCLFYREIAPIGWNIANGGAESAAELLDPLATIERELREELIIVEPTAGHRYVFDWDEGRRADHPDFAVARRVWHEIFQQRDFLQLRDLPLPLKWLPGHDSVVIRFNNQPPIAFTDCLLNINAEDFGIEIDRVAKLAVGPEAVFCDGEVVHGNLLNRVVGLFEVHRFNAAMAAGRKEFFPDRVFWGGRERSQDGVRQVVGEYLVDVVARRVWAMGVWAMDIQAEYEATQCKFGLCPVTRNLIRRFLLLEEEFEETVTPAFTPASLPDSLQKTDVFLSFASEAMPLAQQVFVALQRAGHQVFFSQETLHQANFADAIDTALSAAKSLVVVGTETEHFFKPWVRYEWQSFHNDIMGGRKPWDTPFITFAAKPDRDALPRPLVFREIVACDPTALAPSLQRLHDLLGQPRP